MSAPLVHVRWPEWPDGSFVPSEGALCGQVVSVLHCLDPCTFFQTMPENGVGRCSDCVAAFTRLRGEGLSVIRRDLAEVRASRPAKASRP